MVFSIHDSIHGEFPHKGYDVIRLLWYNSNLDRFKGHTHKGKRLKRESEGQNTKCVDDIMI